MNTNFFYSIIRLVCYVHPIWKSSICQTGDRRGGSGSTLLRPRRRRPINYATGLDLIISRVESGHLGSVGQNWWPVPDPSHGRVELGWVRVFSVIYQDFWVWVKKNLARARPVIWSSRVGSGFFRWVGSCLSGRVAHGIREANWF